VLEARALLRDQPEKEHYNDPTRPRAKGANPGPIRMLVVEDDDGDRLMLASAFQRRGIIVEAACNGMQAITSARKSHFDIALIDYNLPEIDGGTVALLVHSCIEQRSRPRLIAYTATPDVVFSKSTQDGPMFDKILAKSAGIRVLMQTVGDLLWFSPNPDTRRAVAKLTWPTAPTSSETTNSEIWPRQR
jgi:CheY-like chemotaxis protein